MDASDSPQRPGAVSADEGDAVAVVSPPRVPRAGGAQAARGHGGGAKRETIDSWRASPGGVGGAAAGEVDTDSDADVEVASATGHDAAGDDASATPSGGASAGPGPGGGSGASDAGDDGGDSVHGNAPPAPGSSAASASSLRDSASSFRASLASLPDPHTRPAAAAASSAQAARELLSEVASLHSDVKAKSAALALDTAAFERRRRRALRHLQQEVINRTSAVQRVFDAKVDQVIERVQALVGAVHGDVTRAHALQADNRRLRAHAQYLEERNVVLKTQNSACAVAIQALEKDLLRVKVTVRAAARKKAAGNDSGGGHISGSGSGVGGGSPSGYGGGGSSKATDGVKTSAAAGGKGSAKASAPKSRAAKRKSSATHSNKQGHPASAGGGGKSGSDAAGASKERGESSRGTVRGGGASAAAGKKGKASGSPRVASAPAARAARDKGGDGDARAGAKTSRPAWRGSGSAPEAQSPTVPRSAGVSAAAGSGLAGAKGGASRRGGAAGTSRRRTPAATTALALVNAGAVTAAAAAAVATTPLEPRVAPSDGTETRHVPQAVVDLVDALLRPDAPLDPAPPSSPRRGGADAPTVAANTSAMPAAAGTGTALARRTPRDAHEAHARFVRRLLPGFVELLPHAAAAERWPAVQRILAYVWRTLAHYTVADTPAGQAVKAFPGASARGPTMYVRSPTKDSGAGSRASGAQAGKRRRAVVEVQQMIESFVKGLVRGFGVKSHPAGAGGAAEGVAQVHPVGNAADDGDEREAGSGGGAGDDHSDAAASTGTLDSSARDDVSLDNSAGPSARARPDDDSAVVDVASDVEVSDAEGGDKASVDLAGDDDDDSDRDDLRASGSGSDDEAKTPGKEAQFDTAAYQRLGLVGGNGAGADGSVQPVNRITASDVLQLDDSGDTGSQARTPVSTAAGGASGATPGSAASKRDQHGVGEDEEGAAARHVSTTLEDELGIEGSMRDDGDDSDGGGAPNAHRGDGPDDGGAGGTGAGSDGRSAAADSSVGKETDRVSAMADDEATDSAAPTAAGATRVAAGATADAPTAHGAAVPRAGEPPSQVPLIECSHTPSRTLACLLVACLSVSPQMRAAALRQLASPQCTGSAAGRAMFLQCGGLPAILPRLLAAEPPVPPGGATASTSGFKSTSHLRYNLSAPQAPRGRRRDKLQPAAESAVVAVMMNLVHHPDSQDDFLAQCATSEFFAAACAVVRRGLAPAVAHTAGKGGKGKGGGGARRGAGSSPVRGGAASATGHGRGTGGGQRTKGVFMRPRGRGGATGDAAAATTDSDAAAATANGAASSIAQNPRSSAPLAPPSFSQDDLLLATLLVLEKLSSDSSHTHLFHVPAHASGVTVMAALTELSRQGEAAAAGAAVSVPGPQEAISPRAFLLMNVRAIVENVVAATAPGGERTDVPALDDIVRSDGGVSGDGAAAFAYGRDADGVGHSGRSLGVASVDFSDGV